MLFAVGAYSRDLFGAGPEEYKLVLKASWLSAGLVGIGCFLTQYQLSRGFFFLAFTIGVPLLLLWRLVVPPLDPAHPASRPPPRGRHHRRQRRATSTTSRPSCGASPGSATRCWGAHHAWLRAGRDPAGIPVLGTTTDTVAAIEGVDADVVIFADGAFSSAHDLRRAMWDLEGHSVRAIIVPSLTDVSSERLKVRPVAGLPLVHVEAPRAVHASHWAKRAFDVVGSLGDPAADLPGAARDRAGRQAPRRRPGAVPPDPDRARRPPVQLPEVPQHGHRRREPPRRPRGQPRAQLGAVQDGQRPARHAARAGSSAGSRSTSCPSSGTCCAAR